MLFCALANTNGVYAEKYNFTTLDGKDLCDAWDLPILKEMESERTADSEKFCLAYLKGYLDVANHNCIHDVYPDRLHKLDTINISTEQIITPIRRYFEKIKDKQKLQLIDHLWRALSPHWPCQR